MERKQRGFLDGFWLKMIMAALMVLDHLYYDLFPHSLLWGHYLARVVAPIFAFLVAEGLWHTHDRRKYILRILGFAVAMQAGNAILYSIYHEPIENSILMSLGLSAAVIFMLEKAREEKKTVLWILGACAPLYLVQFFEGGFMVTLMVGIFYYLRRRPLWMCSVYVVSFGLIFSLPYLKLGYLPSQFYMIFAVIPILCYNGKRGIRNGFTKYFFYIFYPVHIWIIYLLVQLVK